MKNKLKQYIFEYTSAYYIPMVRDEQPHDKETLDKKDMELHANALFDKVITSFGNEEPQIDWGKIALNYANSLKSLSGKKINVGNFADYLTKMEKKYNEYRTNYGSKVSHAWEDKD